MAHDKKKVADQDRIDMHKPYELAYWSRRFGVSTERVAEAVQKVGSNAEDVAVELGKPW